MSREFEGVPPLRGRLRSHPSELIWVMPAQGRFAERKTRPSSDSTWQRRVAMRASSVKALLYLGVAITGAGSPAAAGNTTKSAPAAPVTCVTQSGVPCPKDHFAMEHEETYKGTKIRIRTGRAPDGAWQATAEVANQTSAAPLAAPGLTHPSKRRASPRCWPRPRKLIAAAPEPANPDAI